MKKTAIFVIGLLLCSLTATLKAQYQLPNSGFEYWDSTSFCLPTGWNSYNTAKCNIQGLPASYAAAVAKIINSTVVHSRTQGSRPGGTGSTYLTLKTGNVNGGGIEMSVCGMVSTGLFNIGSLSVYTPVNYFSTERSKPSFRLPLTSTPDSMYMWVKYYAHDADSSRARIVAYLHGDTDFQYLNHIGNPSLYSGYVHHLVARTDSVLPATHWVQLRMPFVYDGKAAPKYLLMYVASDSCIIGGKIGNELSIDDIELVYSSWLKGILVDSVAVPGFRKTVFSYQFEFPYGTPSSHVPDIRCIGEVNDITDSVEFVPSVKGLDGGRGIIRSYAEDGVSMHTYTINYSIAKSPNAALSSLSYDNKPVPGFHRDSLHYVVWLAPGTTVPPVVACQTEFPGLKPQITQASGLPGTATVRVTAEDGHSQRIYTIVFKVSLSKDATAAWIRYNQLPLAGFHPDSLNYAVELPYGTASVQVTAAASWPAATVRYRQLSALPGTASVTVVAEDTTVRRNYRIAFTVAKNNNARLDSLHYLLGKTRCAIPAFRPDSLFYAVELPEKNKIRPVMVGVPQDARAKVRVDYPILLEDTVRVWVVAENGTDSLCYRVAFRVRKATNALLSSLKVNGRPLGNFKDTVFDYPVLLDSSLVPLVEAVPADSDAQVRILFPSHIPGTVTVTVTAEDTGVHCVYRLYCSIRLSDNADLMSLGYRLGKDYYPVPGFHKDTLFYNVALPPFTETAPVLVWVKADFEASDSCLQPLSPHDTGYVEVRSESGALAKRYRLSFHVSLSRDATLDTVFFNGKAFGGYHPDSAFYTVWLHTDTMTPPVVTVRAARAAVATVRQAAALGDTALVTVRAQDTTVVRQYRICFLRRLSSVSTLSGFSYTLGGADSVVQLVDGVTEYNVRLWEKTTDVPSNLQCELTDSRASVKYFRIPMVTNDTAIIRVLAEDGNSVSVYRFCFYRMPSSDALLDSLWVNGTPLLSFRPDRFRLTCAIPAGTTEPPVVTAKAAWKLSSVYVTQPSTLYDTAQIRVVAEDAVHYNIYTILFHQERQESRLKAIYLDGGYPVPSFSPDVRNYEMYYGPHFPREVTAVPLDSFASYSWSSETHGDTMDISVVCVAEDSVHQTVYSVRVLLPNGVKEAAAPMLRIYPNPASTVLYVSAVKGKLVQLCDMTGRLLMQVEANGEDKLPLDISGLARGMYVVRCGSRVARFVKE